MTTTVTELFEAINPLKPFLTDFVASQYMTLDIPEGHIQYNLDEAQLKRFFSQVEEELAHNPYTGQVVSRRFTLQFKPEIFTA